MNRVRDILLNICIGACVGIAIVLVFGAVREWREDLIQARETAALQQDLDRRMDLLRERIAKLQSEGKKTIDLKTEWDAISAQAPAKKPD